MGIAQDVIIDYTNKKIEVKNERYTVNQLYSYIMETFDESAQMDDLMPMEAATPTLYRMINGWVMTTLSWDFLRSSAVEEGPTNTLDVYTNVRTLGAIETGTELYISQGGTVNVEAHDPYNPESTISPSNTILVVTAGTINTSVSSSGSLIMDYWDTHPTFGKETLGYSSYSNNTFILSDAPQGTYDPAAGTFVIYAPLTGHLDILLKTEEDGADINGTTFTTWARKFQDTYDKFTTTGGAVVANVPVATDSDVQLDIPMATLQAYTGITLSWYETTYFKRSAFDGTIDEQEYTLQNSISASGTILVISNTVAPEVAGIGYLQVEDEVMYYNTIWSGASYSTFGIQDRGTLQTVAVGHLAGKDLSTAMFDYEVLLDTDEGHTLKQLYNWLQWRLLSQGDIDDGAGTRYGWVTDELVVFTGKMFTNQGVFVSRMAAADKSNIQYKDRNGLLHDPPTYIVLRIECVSAMNGGRGVMYRLNQQYDADNYDTSWIVSTLIDDVFASGKVETTIKYQAAWWVLSRARKAGRIPWELGGQLSAADYIVTAINPEDTIYTP